MQITVEDLSTSYRITAGDFATGGGQPLFVAEASSGGGAINRAHTTQSRIAGSFEKKKSHSSG